MSDIFPQDDFIGGHPYSILFDYHKLKFYIYDNEWESKQHGFYSTYKKARLKIEELLDDDNERIWESMNDGSNDN